LFSERRPLERPSNKILDAVNREKADALAISPVDPVAQKRTINMAALRAVVMTQDSDAPDTNRVLYIGANNREAGRQAGELLKSALPNGGKVMAFVGRSEVQNAKDRFEGIKEAIAGSKIEILGLMTDESDLTEAKDNVRSTIKKHSDIAGMVGLWSYNGPAILRAIRDAKKEGSIKIVCFDDDKDTLKGIKDGAIFGTVAQQPYEYGYQAVHLARKILDGDRSVIPESKQVLIPTRVIQKKDVDEYTNKQAKLLGKA
jgi:ribose transport system substrate-binding protein